MSSIGGAGWPAPPLPPGHKPGMDMGAKVNMSRGVDLQAIKDRHLYRHRWVMVANFVIEDKTVAKMAEVKLAADNARARGEDPDQPQIALNMSPDNMIGVDGPGCVKCGVAWNGIDGHGKLCSVSDDAYAHAGNPTLTPQPGPMTGPLGIVDDAYEPPSIVEASSEDTTGRFALLDPDGVIDRVLPVVEDQPLIAVAQSINQDTETSSDNQDGGGGTDAGYV